MNTKLVTVVIVLIGLVAMVGWDLVVNFNRVEGDTISELFANAIRAYPVLALVLGVVVGHLVGSMVELKPVLTWIGEHPIVAHIYGFIGGVLFWNMAR